MKSIHTVMLLCLLLGLSSLTIQSQDICHSIASLATTLPDSLDVQHWHRDGYCGQDIRIGIINSNFPIQEAVVDLLNNGQLKIYPVQQNEWDNTTSDLQALRIIQVLNTVAPRAEIYFYRLKEANGFIEAAKWMESENVRIVVNLVAHPTFEADSLKEIDTYLDTIQTKNILWLNTAGNYGNSYYEASFDWSKSRVNGWHYFGNGEQGLLPISINDLNAPSRIYIIWDNPSAALEAEVLKDPSILGNFAEDASYKLMSNQRIGILTIEVGQQTKTFYLTVFDTNYFRENDRNTHFSIYMSNAVITSKYRVGGDSIPSPNNHPSVLTVGATSSETSLLASSQSSILQKPELMTWGQTETGELSSGIATVVTAGMTSLLWSKQPDLTAMSLKQQLLDSRGSDHTLGSLSPQPQLDLTFLPWAILVVGIVVLFGVIWVLWRPLRRQYIKRLFDNIQVDVKLTQDQSGLAVTLRPDFDKQGFPMIARYCSILHVDVIFEPVLGKKPELHSPLLEMSGSDGISVQFLTGILAVARERSHAAITNYFFTPDNKTSFDIHFKHMLPSKGPDPVIVWYYDNLAWVENPLKDVNVRIDLSTPQQRITRTLPVKTDIKSSTLSVTSQHSLQKAPQRNRVFLSYRSSERDFAMKLALDLRQKGIRVWMDALGGIPAGADWEKTLQETIDSDETVGMIAVLSPDYIASKNCMRELRRADRADDPKFIVPVLLKKISSEQMPMNVQDLQYVDFTNWSNEADYQAKLPILVSRLKSNLNKKS